MTHSELDLSSLRYDLHTHSTASDGTLSPEQLVARACEKGVEVLALTDHDTVRGIRSLLARDIQGIRLIGGTELTCLWGKRVVHIVGLNVDTESQELHQYLSEIDQLRVQRAQQIAQRLVKKGLPDLLPAAKDKADEGVIGRPHFAAAMVAEGIVRTEQQAFSQYLGTGKVGDVKMAWPTMEQAIEVIRQAGGIAVLAHPTKYRFTFTKIRELLTDFKAQGGGALEVSYIGISPSHQQELIKLALKHDLLISAGSDFHSPGQHWTEVGRFTPIKQSAPHILEYIL